MSCKNCTPPKERRYETRACTVCTLVNQDTTPKRAYYCNFCKAWICVECEPSLIDRGLAALKARFTK